MNTKKIFGWILKLPLMLLNILTLGVGIVAALGYIPGFLISWAAPIIIGGIQLAYLLGSYLIHTAKKDSTAKEGEISTQQEEVLDQGEYNPEQEYSN